MEPENSCWIAVPIAAPNSFWMSGVMLMPPSFSKVCSVPRISKLIEASHIHCAARRDAGGCGRIRLADRAEFFTQGQGHQASHMRQKSRSGDARRDSSGENRLQKIRFPDGLREVWMKSARKDAQREIYLGYDAIDPREVDYRSAILSLRHSTGDGYRRRWDIRTEAAVNGAGGFLSQCHA